MTPLEWTLLMTTLVLLVVAVLALAVLDEVRAENYRLRRRIHPATRRTVR